MKNALIAQKICSGILAGNEKLRRWTGGNWVCDRQNTEYFLVEGVGEVVKAKLPDWLIWPETTADGNFNWLGTSYMSRVNDCPPATVFGGVRYDLGLLPSLKLLSGLVEIKKSWDEEYLRNNKHDLVKLAHALLYLGIRPPLVQNHFATGVALESVFFGTFLWCEPRNGDFTAQPLAAQFDKIRAQVDQWWSGATTGGGRPIQAEFEREYGACPQPGFAFEVMPGIATETKLEAGAACVWLSLGNE